MIVREIIPGVRGVGAIDFNRRLFDALIPTPDGTSYNAYLVEGTQRTALIDTVDPSMSGVLLANLQAAKVERLDYVVVNHAEQDHSGSLPAVLERYPAARVVTNEKCKDQLIHLFPVSADRFVVIKDRETLDLGGKTLEFMLAPWVHWPETMFTYLREDRLLFSCDFLGAHVGTSQLFVENESAIYEPAKRYYAEILMPFRTQVKSHLEKLSRIPIDLVAPSHGPVHRQPAWILGLYRDWVADAVKNEVVIPFVSMHGSTERMVAHFVSLLMERELVVTPFDLSQTDTGKLAMALVDAATVVLATPTVLFGPHPLAVYAAFLINALRPKTRIVGIVGSFGSGGKTVDQLVKMFDQLKVEFLPPILVKGAPRPDDLAALVKLADNLQLKHREIGAV